MNLGRVVQNLKEDTLISAWHLVWIIPLTGIVGFSAAAILAMGACSDCREAFGFEQRVAEAKSYEDGFREGLSKVGEVG